MLSKLPRDLLILLALCGVLFGWRLGYLGLLDPDEPFYAETAVEMVESHELLVPRIFGEPQFEKPVLFYWAVIASQGLFGRTEFAARAPAAVCGLLLVVMTWAFGVRLFGRRAGFLAAVVLATSVAFVVISRMVLTDMMFALFVCGSCFAFWLAAGDERPRPWMVVVAGAGVGFAVLTKGPLGALVPALAAVSYLLIARRRPPGDFRTWALSLAVALLIAAPWYAYMIHRFGNDYVRAFFVHENYERFVTAEHRSNNRPYYYPLVILVGFLPWIPALVVGLLRARRFRPRPGAPTYLALWILTSLIFFTLAASKLPTYILFLFVPVALLLGRMLDRLLDHGFEGPLERWLALGFGAFQSAGLLAVFAFPDQSAFYAMAGAAAVVLAMAAIAQVSGRLRWWIALSAAGMIVFVGAAMTWSARAIESTLSMKPAVARALQTGHPPSGSLLSSPQLARGLFYYMGRPVGVLTNRERPFFTPHPLRIVRGGDSLMVYVREHGPTTCFVRQREWRRVRPHAYVTDSLQIGNKVIVRLEDMAPLAERR